MPTKQQKLTPRQTRFVEEYAIDRNGTQAAIRAGYSPRSAEVTACRLLSKDKIKAAVADAMRKVTERVEVTQEMVLAEYKRIAFSDLRNLAHWNDDGVCLHPSAELSDDAAATVKEIKVQTTQTETEHGITTSVRKEIKQHDKLRALEVLAKYTGLHDADGDDGDRVILVLPEWAKAGE